MSDTQVFDAFVPLVKSDNVENIKVGQTLASNPLTLTGPDTVKVVVQGPQYKLTPDDIHGVYPAAGSEESPDEFFPHIALARRTLPWERVGPGAGNPSDDWPWMALLLFKESELRPNRNQAPTVTLADSTIGQTPVKVLTVTNSLLKDLLPPQPEQLRYFTHVKRTGVEPNNTDIAIVVSSRLPDAGTEGKPEIHTAALVSLEKRGDVYSAIAANPGGQSTLVVLHSWNFTPSRGGDFEQVMKSIRFRPNGGVLRFGSLPRPVEAGEAALAGGFASVMDDDGYLREPLEETVPGDAAYRSPLRPFPTQGRSKGFAARAAAEEFANAGPDEPLDYSHACAFELGRMLALSDSGVLEDLGRVGIVPHQIKTPDLVNPLPDALQKPDWVVNPAWSADPWQNPAAQSLVKDTAQFLQKGIGDVAGVKDHLLGKAAILAQLNPVATPGPAVVVAVNIAGVNAAQLEKEFADVLSAGLG
jgi:hypothetical protein